MKTSTRTHEGHVALVQRPRPRHRPSNRIGAGTRRTGDRDRPQTTARDRKEVGSTATTLRDVFCNGSAIGSLCTTSTAPRGQVLVFTHRRLLRGTCSQLASHERSQYSPFISAAEVNASPTFHVQQDRALALPSFLQETTK
jgi:hypothetical protein